MLRAYLVDDEPLALRRLERLLSENGRVEIAGTCSDPVRAAAEIELLKPDVVFLDIQMPEMTGFELLSSLGDQPLVIFTTAYDQYALRAFEVNSIDYLLKPIEPEHLERALAKLERVGGRPQERPSVTALLQQVTAALKSQTLGKSDRENADRIASRIGERIHFVELARVTHFFAEDKLTYAATQEKNWVIDKSIAELEERLDARRWLRVHRSSLVNLDYVDELLPWFGGRMVLKLRDAKKTEVTVARDRVKELKERLGI